MKVSKKTEERIESVVKDEELKINLLSLNADSIRKLPQFYELNPEDVIKAYESNDSEEMKKLYDKAILIVELRKLYKELCLEYAKSLKKQKEEDIDITE